ncbi:hypothetical protein KR215_009783 [Drosophila sulfurigaster]|nr:hypothetical protein KR215_009783 [Drosophila sulfurigaster]
METSDQQASPIIERRECQIKFHRLRVPYRTISDRNILNFLRFTNPDIRSTSLVCEDCYNNAKQVYLLLKARRAKNKDEGTDSISDVSSVSSSVVSAPSSAILAPSTDSTSSQEQQTSQTLGARRRRDYDDDYEMLSPNAFNGTRLPHIQPIPKRRKDALDHLDPFSRAIIEKGMRGG